MIVFDLKCGPQGHVFEGWFASSEDYESQRIRHLVSCPICGAGAVDKAPMAPRVGAKGNQGPARASKAMKNLLGEMAVAQKNMLANSDFVGDRFPDEARAIHTGEAEERAIHGRASPDDARSLIEDGIPVAPLPFRVPEPGEEN